MTPPDAPAWLYVLHFKTKLAHAQHYVGQTVNLKRRLATHRASKGARLIQVLNLTGIEWTIGGAYRTRNRKEARRWETRIKRQKHAARWCQICNPGKRRSPLEDRTQEVCTTHETE